MAFAKFNPERRESLETDIRNMRAEAYRGGDKLLLKAPRLERLDPLQVARRERAERAARKSSAPNRTEARVRQQGEAPNIMEYKC